MLLNGNGQIYRKRNFQKIDLGYLDLVIIK